MSTEQKEAPVQEVTAPQAVKPKTPTPLTAEEKQELEAFIGKCVLRNASIPGGTRFNVQTRQTVQDICALSPESIKNLRVTIKTALDKHEAALDDDDDDSKLLIGGINAEKWINFLKLLSRKKRYEAHASQVRSQIKLLEKEIEDSLTPQERRQRAQQQLANLSSIGITPNDED